ncbi:7476_t:CDS:2, partial [Acaulospora morrowiae]
ENESEGDSEEHENGVKDRKKDTVEQVEDDESDVVSDQEKMMEDFDSKLVEYFKQQKLEKSRKKDVKYQKIHFKYKIIGLLRIFAYSQPQNSLIFELVVPLLELSKNPRSNEISGTASVLLKKLISNKEVPTQFDDDHVLDLIQQVHNLSHRAKDGDLAKTCWKAGLYLFRSLILRYEEKERKALPTKYSNRSIEKAVSIYENSYQGWMTRSNYLTIASFSELPNILPQVPWYLSDIFFGCTDPGTAKNPKQVMRAYDISRSIFNYFVPKKKRGSAVVDSVINIMIEKMSVSLETTLQFISRGSKCGGKPFNSEILASIMKDVVFAIKRINEYRSKKE